MPFYEKGNVRIAYQEAGSGFPLFVISGGGLNSKMNYANGPFDAFAEFKSEYRCISMDLRNANGGQSTGPLDLEQPWHAHTGDHISLLDHLGVDKFFVMGFCIGNPLIWNLMQRAPGRIVAAVSAQPSGVDPKNPKWFYNSNIKGWAPGLLASRPEINMEMVQKFLDKMYGNVDFVLTATGELSRNRRVGLLLAAGRGLPEILVELGHVAEGVYSAATVLARARALGVEMPITEAVVEVLEGRSSPEAALWRLMTRQARPESA